MTKVLQKPMQIMENIVNGNITNYEKYMMYSAHDNHIAVLWLFLNASNFNWYTIPFASQIYFELRLTSRGEYKLYIHSNGIYLTFGGIDDSFSSTKAYLESLTYRNKGFNNQSFMNLQCSKKFSIISYYLDKNKN